MFTKAFLLAALERAVKTFAQSLVALFLAGTTILNIDWQQSLAVAATAALVSVLTSVASNGIGAEGPSLGGEVLDAPADTLEVGDH